MKPNKEYRILIIDDDIDLLMLMERRLTMQGFEVEAAAGLQEGEEMIHIFQPDLVLLDIRVRNEDGRALCWKLKQDRLTRHIKIFMISGFDVSRSRSALFGANEMLPKPINFEYLLHLIDQYRDLYEEDTARDYHNE